MTDLNTVSASLYTTVRELTETPKEGVGACVMALYIIWKETKTVDDYPLEAFIGDVSASLRDLHLMNDVKGEA